MKRRTFLACLAAAAGTKAWPARAQKPPPRIAFVTFGSSAHSERWLSGLREGLKAHGYENGRNIALEARVAGFSLERAERQAAEVVASRPAVIVAQGRAILTLSKRTKSIPIVAAFSGDVELAGFAESLARPLRNVTGMQLLYFELVGKRIEILKEIMPGLKRLAVIASPFHPGVERERYETEAAAEKLGIAVSYHPVRNAGELVGGLEALRAAGAQAIVSFPDGITYPLSRNISQFALEHRIATVSGWDVFADDGHLVMYGPNLRAVYTRLASHVDRILKGAKPTDIPFELPTTFELGVNLRTARALGVSVPQSVLLRADRVIE